MKKGFTIWQQVQVSTSHLLPHCLVYPMNQYRTTIVIYCHYYQAILLALTGSMGQTYY